MRGDRNRYRDVNKPRAYRVDPVCKGKQRYPDEVSVRAWGAVAIAERKNTDRLWCYRCRHCSGWHLTSNNYGKRWEIHGDDPAPAAGRIGWRVLEVDGKSIRDGRAIEWTKQLLAKT